MTIARTFVEVGDRTVYQYDGRLSRAEAINRTRRHLQQLIDRSNRQLKAIDRWNWGVRDKALFEWPDGADGSAAARRAER